jgi:hypothetical protein
VHVLIVTPVIFYLMKTQALRKGTLRLSAMSEHAAGRQVLDGAL